MDRFECHWDERHTSVEGYDIELFVDVFVVVYEREIEWEKIFCICLLDFIVHL